MNDIANDITIKKDYRWGACPECLSDPLCLNVGDIHWFVCHTHKSKWCVGSDRFSGWQFESEELHQENAAKLAEYTEIKPVNSSLEVWDKLSDDQKEQVRRSELVDIVREFGGVRSELRHDSMRIQDSVDKIDRLLNHIAKLWPELALTGINEAIRKDDEAVDSYTNNMKAAAIAIEVEERVANLL